MTRKVLWETFFFLYFYFFWGKTLAEYQNDYFKVNKKTCGANLRQKSFFHEIADKCWLIFLFSPKNIDSRQEINYIQFNREK
jgi:hypothetical protein